MSQLRAGRVLLACSDKAQDGHPMTKNYLVQNVNGAKVENPNLEGREDLLAMGRRSSRNKEILIQTGAGRYWGMSRSALQSSSLRLQVPHPPPRFQNFLTV